MRVYQHAASTCPLSHLQKTFLTLRFAAYDPLTAPIHPDLSQAKALANVPDGSECSIFAGDVNVYYFPTAKPTNTHCYTGTGAPPVPTEIANPVFPNVYVVVNSLSAGNSHTCIGSTYNSVVFTMKPHELSTIAGTAGPSQIFNFADLPCPPPEVAAADKYFYDPETNPTRPYMPRIVPPSQILELNPAWKSCTFPANFQFFDPPSALPMADGGGDGGPGNKKRDLPPMAPEAMITPPPTPIDWHRGHPRQVVP